MSSSSGRFHGSTSVNASTFRCDDWCGESMMENKEGDFLSSIYKT